MRQDRCMGRTGALFCLASAAAFGAMAVFGKLAYDEGVTVGTLLPARFLVAASVLWLLLAASGRLATVRALPRRDALLALALGAVGYSAQAGAYFAALERLDAGLLGLVLYTFPVMVTVAAVALGRERFTTRSGLALALACGGIGLVLAGAAGGALDPAGVALAVAAAVVYSTYILVSDGVAERLEPLALATLVCTGAAATLTVGALALGDLRPGAVSAGGYGWLAALSLVSTVGAIVLFFAGLRRVGPTAASILSTLEPVVTVALAALVFGEALGPAQLVGGALVLGAAVVLRAPGRAQHHDYEAPIAAVSPAPSRAPA
jgi:drug/metabolite transporter (DMT)-like permease